MRKNIISLLLSVCVAGIFNSCATFSSPSYDISGVRVEHKKNGYLVDLRVNHAVGDVAAFISKDNWLIVTVVGATVDFDRLRAMEPNGLITECQIVGSRTSVQVTLKLREEFRSCEVIRSPDGTDVSIALFSK